MAKKDKQRSIDYSTEELRIKSSLKSSQAFDNRLQKFCDIYKVDPNEFKVFPDETYSPRFFPAEIGELLAILLKNLGKHPSMQKSEEKVNLSSLCTYFKDILTDLDNCEQPIFRDIISTYNSYQNALDVIFWAPILMEELTLYLYNSIVLKNVTVGAFFEELTKHLDKLNYDFFIHNFITESAKNSTSNYTGSLAIKQGLMSSENVYYDKILDSPNLSIDLTLAILIKRFLSDTKKIKKERDFDNICADTDISALFDLLSERAQRELYLEETLESFYSQIEQYNSFNEACQKKRLEWKPIAAQIKESDYSHCQYSRSKNEYIDHLESQIKITKDHLSELEKNLEEAKNLDESVFINKGNLKFAKLTGDRYLTSYEDITNNPDSKFNRLQNNIDNFFGQVMIDLLKIV